MKVCILGTGAYGIALSLMFYKNKCDITMWTKFKEEKKLLEDKRMNNDLLKGVKLPKEIKFTNDLKDAIEGKDIIVIALPAQYVDDIALEISKYYKKKQHICIATKGIEQDTCLFIDDVISKYIKTKNIAVISGPSFAIDIVSNFPIGLSLGTKSKTTEIILKKYLQNDSLKLRVTDDLIGVEICRSIKNVIAIASGILDGLGANESTQAMFITESLHDIKSLIKALGGHPNTILSFSGFGDLLLTCTSTKSRNFTYGRLIGKNTNKSIIDEYINTHTIEGLYTLKSIYKLINKKKVDMPIIDLIYDIIFNNKKPNILLKFLIEKE